MSRLKKTVSKPLRIAAVRAASMEAIDPLLDLGGGVTLPAYKALIKEVEAQQAAYNGLLSEVDQAKRTFHAGEARLRDMSARMLAGTITKFGRDSDEYLKAGGSPRVRRRRASSAPASDPQAT